jgi:putative solute:sodium symporter small subunit
MGAGRCFVSPCRRQRIEAPGRLLRRIKALAHFVSSLSGFWATILAPPRRNKTIRRAPMQLTQKHHEYWNKNLRITAILLAIWFVVTFVAGWFARELNEITLIGPLGFYMGAQGALIVYVLIIWYYARYMNKLDKEYGVHEGEDD